MFLQLSLYPTFLKPLLVSFLTRTMGKPLEPTEFGSIAIAPANNISKVFVDRMTFGDMSPYSVFDRNTNKDFPLPVHNYNEISKGGFKRYLIFSPLFGESIKETLVAAGADPEGILSFASPEPIDVPGFMDVSKVIDISLAASYLPLLKSKENCDILQRLAGNKPLLVISGGGFYDLFDKAEISRKFLSMQVIWLEETSSPCLDHQHQIIKANLIDTLNFVRERENRNDVVFFVTHSNNHFTLPALIRKSLKGIKIISYIYDWLNLFCPYGERELFRKYAGQEEDYINSEYETLNEMLDGGIVDGIIHKDGGVSLKPLENCPLPKLFFPTYMSEAIYEEPPKGIEEASRFLFLGSLYSPSGDAPSLFSDVFLFDIFSDIAGQGFSIDVYYPPAYEEVGKEYQSYFQGNAKIRISQGEPLNTLFPKLQGKYHFGFMVYYFDDSFVPRQHIEVTLPSKVFAYLALGVPIVISEEMRFAAELVRKHGLGIVVSRDETKDMKAVIAKHDYRKLQENILAFRKEHSLERKESEFIRFLDSILRR